MSKHNEDVAWDLLGHLEGPFRKEGIEAREENYQITLVRGDRSAIVLLPEQPVSRLDVLNCVCRAADEVRAHPPRR